MKRPARLFTALFISQTLLGFPAQAVTGQAYEQNRPTAQIAPAQAAINSEASDAGLITTDVASPAYIGVGGSRTGVIANVASDVAAGGGIELTGGTQPEQRHCRWQHHRTARGRRYSRQRSHAFLTRRHAGRSRRRAHPGRPNQQHEQASASRAAYPPHSAAQRCG